MSVKQEHKDGEGITRKFEETFESYLQGISKGFWYLGDAIPILKDVRGKIVLLRRFNWTQGINANPWADDTTFPLDVPNKEQKQGTLQIQDEYTVEDLSEVPPDEIPTIPSEDPMNPEIPVVSPTHNVWYKWNAIKKHLDKARGDTSKDNWYINFTSGTSPLAYPNAVAGRINHRVSAYIEDKSLTHVRLGTIVTDFPDDNGKTDMVNRSAIRCLVNHGNQSAHN
jgi:1-phosphatidylinositol phosphodiesterase